MRPKQIHHAPKCRSRCPVCVPEGSSLFWSQTPFFLSLSRSYVHVRLLKFFVFTRVCMPSSIDSFSEKQVLLRCLLAVLLLPRKATKCLLVLPPSEAHASIVVWVPELTWSTSLPRCPISGRQDFEDWLAGSG